MRAKGRLKGKFFARKTLVILLIAVVLIIFGRVVDNKSLTQSGIAVGIGIDFKDEKYNITVQVVTVSGGAGSDKGTTNYLTYSAEGKTIGEAVNSVSEKIGLVVSLSHCNLVIMSRSALSLNPIRTFSALTKALSLPEQALVVATDEDIPSLFASKIPTTENISFFLQSVLLQDLEAGGLTSVSVKDYLALRTSRSGGVALPYLEIFEMPDKPISDSPGGSDKNYIVSINKNLVIDDDGDKVVDEITAKAVNMFLSSEVKDKLTVSLPDGGVIEFRIIKNSKSVKVNGMTVTAELKMNVSFVEAQGFDTPFILNCNSPEVLEARDLLEKQLTEQLKATYLLSQECGIDFLGLENLVYRKAGRTLEEGCLDKINFEAFYQIKVTENS